MDFNVIESSDAIRLTFNAWPHSKLEATRCVLPLAAMYTPNKVLPNMPVSWVPLRLVQCRKAGCAVAVD